MGRSALQAGSGAPLSRWGRLAGVLAACCALLRCAGGDPEDFLARRCVDVLRYRQPELASISVERVTHRGSSRILAYEASAPGRKRVTDHIACRFGPGDPWALEAATIGDRDLSDVEITLVNAELLLNDLSRHPERLRKAPNRQSSRNAASVLPAPS